MGQGLGDWTMNQSQDSKRWKSNPRHGTNGPPGEHLQGCRGRTSGKLSLCSPEWDPGRGILLDFDSSCQWPALVGEGREGGALGKAMILGSGRGMDRGCAKL